MISLIVQKIESIKYLLRQYEQLKNEMPNLVKQKAELENDIKLLITERGVIRDEILDLRLKTEKAIREEFEAKYSKFELIIAEYTDLGWFYNSGGKVYDNETKKEYKTGLLWGGCMNITHFVEKYNDYALAIYAEVYKQNHLKKIYSEQ